MLAAGVARAKPRLFIMSHTFHFFATNYLNTSTFTFLGRAWSDSAVGQIKKQLPIFFNLLLRHRFCEISKLRFVFFIFYLATRLYNIIIKSCLKFQFRLKYFQYRTLRCFKRTLKRFLLKIVIQKWF